MKSQLNKKIIEPTIKGLNAIGCSFVGILYAGLMIKDNEPKLIEYNIRFGDPECQVLMMRLENDLLDLILSIKNKRLQNEKISWNKNPCITVVAAAKGYPEKYKFKTEIKNLENIENNSTQQLFHAGTIKVDNRILANGGRVLNATTMASNLNKAREKAHSILDLVDWEDKYFRKDIGWRAIK